MVELRQLLAALPAQSVPALTVCDLTDDTRTLTPGSLFIARTGPRTDGRDHIAAAVTLGAAAILAEAPLSKEHRAAAGTIPIIELDDLPKHTSAIAERFFGEPTASLTLVGITGTNGKTTIAHLTAALLRAAGIETACIGTLGADIAGETHTTNLTTPGAIELSRLLARARDAGAKAAVIEVSSHALDQHRTAALHFNAAVFTNLTRDHLDDHATMTAYAAAKAKLFTSLAPAALAIINTTDPAHTTMLAHCTARTLRCTENATVNIEHESLDGLTLTLRGPWGKVTATPRLIGAFNAMNALQAFAAAYEVCTKLGVSTAKLAETLSTLTAPPGRLERVGDSLPRIYVDYAHTPAALESTLRALRPLLPPSGKLICVFGCGGDRDPGKRPEMGRVVSELADTAIVTSDNPRTENPNQIITHITAGMTGPAEIHTTPDRAAAIHDAITRARINDVIVIAGKGHETYQLLPNNSGGVTRIDFDDKNVVRTALATTVVS